MEKIKLKTGPWNLTDLKSIPKNGLKVFSCFHCGGGSSMGYKLAGYEVLGGVEIDPEMMAIYRQNHNPKHSYLMGVQEFKKISDSELPAELFDLDILDGSPPCSSFSMAGSREKKWQVKKKFREGQTEQVLDDLFFDYIDIAKKLRPKVVVAENVKGLILGNAKGYVKQIFQAFREAGYSCQLFLLNAAAMGVPQKRERTFFIANRIDKKIKLDFNERVIPVKNALQGITVDHTPAPRKSLADYWHLIEPGKSVSSVNDSGSGFCRIKLNPNDPANTQIASLPAMHWLQKRHLCSAESLRIQSFPDDYACKQELKHYVCGMSVPPFMMQRIASQIAIQFFDKKEFYV
jgi:DNA (cytosine-5)-methyltransferase 1